MCDEKEDKRDQHLHSSAGAQGLFEHFQQQHTHEELHLQAGKLLYFA